MSSTILELRQAQASQVYKNGDYMVNLPFKTEIEEGDQIVVSKTFIDTQSESSQRINVPAGGLELTIKGYKYVANVGLPVSATTYVSPFKAAATGQTLGDPVLAAGDLFIPCAETEGADFTVFQWVELIFTSSAPQGYSPHGILKIEYTKPNDSAGTWSSAESLNPPDRDNLRTRINIGVHIKTGTQPTISWIPSASSQSPNPNNAKIFQPSFDQYTNVRGLEPILFTFTANLPAGSYSEQELVTQLNDIFQTNIPTFNTDAPEQYIEPDQSAFFNAMPDPRERDAGLYGEDNLFFVQATGNIRTDAGVGQISPVCRLSVNASNPPDTIWVGASAVALDYIPTTNQFVWSYLHTPFYNSAQEVVGINKTALTETTNPDTLGDDWHSVTKSGGFFITSLEARDSNGISSDFWTNDLGFSLTNDVTSGASSLYIRQSGTLQVEGGDQYLIPLFGGTPTTSPPTEGINMTGGYSAMASMIGTGSPSDPEYRWWSSPELPLFNPVAGTTKILGSQKGVLGQQGNAGYFLLEVNGGFLNHMYDTDNDHQFTKAIISRYYSQDSYTSGTSGDSLVYVHKGPANLIQSFRIRILNPDRIVPDNLGTGSAVFVELIKAQQPALPAPAPVRK